MITENIKKGTGLGHDAALRVDLVQKKADYEKSGYKFNHDETLGWEAKINESAYGPFERLEALLDHLDGLKEIEDTFRPVRPVTDENRVPDGTRVTFPHNGQTLEGKIDTLIFPHNGTYCIKAMVGGIESEFYLRPGEFEVLAEEAAETVETETAAPADVKSIEDRAVEILVRDYFSAAEIESVRSMEINAAKKALTKKAADDLREGGTSEYFYATSKVGPHNTVIGFWFGSRVSATSDATVTVARIASLVVEKQREAAPAAPEGPSLISDAHRDAIKNNPHFKEYAGKTLAEIENVKTPNFKLNDPRREEWNRARWAAAAILIDEKARLVDEAFLTAQGGKFRLRDGEKHYDINFYFNPNKGREIFPHVDFEFFAEDPHPISETGYRSSFPGWEGVFESRSFADWIEKLVFSQVAQNDAGLPKKKRPERDFEIFDLTFGPIDFDTGWEYRKSLKDGEKDTKPAEPVEDLPNVGDVPEVEKWAQDECRDLEAKGWVFTPDENWNYTFSYDGITFGPHPTLERCVEGARSLDALRAAGNVEELKQIAFERAVERLCVLQFKLDQADDALTTTTEPFGSDELNRIQKEFKVANDSFEKAWGLASGAECQKCNELYDRKDSAKSRGWEFDLDAKDNWSATLEGVGVQGYNSLERLLSWIRSTEKVYEEEENAVVEAFAAKLELKEEPVRAGEEAETVAEAEKGNDYLWTFTPEQIKAIKYLTTVDDVVAIYATEGGAAGIKTKKFKNGTELCRRFVLRNGNVENNGSEEVGWVIPASILTPDVFFDLFPMEEEAETVAAETAAPETEEAAPAGQMTLDEIEEVEDFLTNGWAIRKRDSGAYWAHKVINGKPVTIEETDFDDFLCRMEEFDPPKDVRPAETLPTSEIKKVRFQLTDEDVKMKTDSLLEVMTVIDTKKTALADIKKDYKKALDKLQEEQDELADQIRSRVEYRPIECLIEYDLNRGEKIYYRPDTQEQIDRVSMSKDELRIALANQNQANLKHGQKDLF